MAQIIIDENPPSDDLGIKRCYVPGTKIIDICPKCQAEKVLDLSQQYISYPVLNSVNKINMYCGECEHEWELNVFFKIDLTLV